MDISVPWAQNAPQGHHPASCAASGKQRSQAGCPGPCRRLLLVGIEFWHPCLWSEGMAGPMACYTMWAAAPVCRLGRPQVLDVTRE